MHSLRVHAVFFAILSLPLTAAGVAPAQDTLAPARMRFADRLTPCRVPGLEEDVLCGRLEVFENRAARSGRRIALNIVVLPARSDRPAPDPLTFLAGGGVLPATRYARTFARSLAGLRETRDIVLVDQRGTGKSNPLACRAFDERKAPIATESEARDTAEACLAEVEQIGDPRFYTTAIAMDDLDDVREWLGYARWNIWGASYGSKAAQVYLRQHPERVRTLVLHGVVPLSVPMWLDLAASAQAGLDALWAACGADADCRSAFPKARAEFNELLSRLAKSSVLVKWEDPQTGKPLEKTVTERDARDLVYALLYSVPLAVQIPMVVHRALGGDFDAFAEPPPGPGEIPRGVLLSLLCSEELERVDRARIAEASARSFLGDWPLRMQMAWCDAWPKGAVPGSFRSAVASDVPALLMTGAFDSTTPPRYAETVARTLSRAKTVRLANRAHNDADACVTDLVQAFVVKGSADGLDASCLANAPPLKFPRTPAELGPPRR